MPDFKCDFHLAVFALALDCIIENFLRYHLGYHDAGNHAFPWVAARGIFCDAANSDALGNSDTLKTLDRQKFCVLPSLRGLEDFRAILRKNARFLAERV